MVIHKFEMPNGGIAYCGDEMAEEIDREVLKQLYETCGTSKSNKIPIYNITCNEQFSNTFHKALKKK